MVPEYITGDTDGAVDLRGTKVIYGIVNDYFFENDSTLGYINNTELGDLAVKRIKDINEKYNCNVVFDYVAVGAQTVYNYAVAGSYVFDILSDETYDIVKFIDSGIYIDLIGVDYIDVFDTTKWGNKYMNMSVMYKGAIYGVLPAQHPMRLSNSIENIIAVNEDYITDIAGNDPRDYFENGEWNWDSFEDCLRNFAHTGVTSNEFIYSFSGLFGRFSRELGMSNGTKLFEVSDDGSYTFGYFSPTAIDAYMVLTKSDSIAYKMENFGLVPVPYGPSASGPQDYSTSYRAADFTLCIPVTAHDFNTSALIIDSIYEPFPGYETRESVIEYLARNYFKDARDAKFYIEMTDDEHTYYHDHHRFSGMFDQFRNTGITRGIESTKDKYINLMLKEEVPYYSTLVQYEEYFHD